MKISGVAALALAVFLAATHAAGADDFKSRIEKILNNPCIKNSKICLEVKSARNGNVYYQKNPDEPMVPASNQKIITSAAALKTLKPWYKFDTIVSYTGEKRGDVLNGDLVISGRGDPHLVTEDLWSIANEIRKRGFRQITGNLLLDEGFFDGEPFPAGWRISSIRKAYEAPGGALSLNFNTVMVTVFAPSDATSKPKVVIDPQTQYFTVVNNLATGGRGRSFVAIRLKPRQDGGEILEVIGRVHPGTRETYYYRAIAHPAYYFGQTLAELLKSLGVTIGGEIAIAPPAKPTSKMFIHTSRPLINQVMDMNKFSNNFMAEQLLKTMGAEQLSGPGTVSKGVSVVENLLNSWGFANRFHIADGSGLSKDNRLSCSLLTDVLGKLYKEWEAGPEFITSLAVMGKEGSVKKRNFSATNPIRVKTGTLDAVSALSGYYPLDNGEVLAFSMIFNNLRCHHGMAQHIQNRLLLEFETLHDDEKQ